MVEVDDVADDVVVDEERVIAVDGPVAAMAALKLRETSLSSAAIRDETFYPNIYQ